jgi:hypothetical protein
MASGHMFGAVRLPANSSWADGTRAATANTSMFAAGDKMDKNALTSAWFNYYKLPFAWSVQVTATLSMRNDVPPPKPGAAVTLYCIVREHDTGLLTRGVLGVLGDPLTPRRGPPEHLQIRKAP